MLLTRGNYVSSITLVTELQLLDLVMVQYVCLMGLATVLRIKSKAIIC